MNGQQAQRHREVLAEITVLLDQSHDQLSRLARAGDWMSPIQLIAGQANTVAGIASTMLADALWDGGEHAYGEHGRSEPVDIPATADLVGMDLLELLGTAEELAGTLPATFLGLDELVVGLSALIRDVGNLG